MRDKIKIANEMVESVGKIQQILGITPQRDDAEKLNKELQNYIENFLIYRDIEELESDTIDESNIIKY